MASKIPYATSAEALFHPARNTVFFKDWQADVDSHNHDLLCAEMSRLAYAEGEAVTRALAGIGFANVGFIDVRGTQGFVAKSLTQDVTVLAFRGTEPDDFADLIIDLDTLPTEFSNGGQVHAGFLKAYTLVRARVMTLLQERAGSLFVTGHSLGAALATLAAVDPDTHPTTLITFGSPHVGDAQFRRLFESLSVRRFVNCCDVVCRIPPEQFDGDHLFQLLTELGDLERFTLPGPLLAGARAAAELLSAPFRSLAAANKFTHVAPPRYIRANGMLAEELTRAQIAQEQRAARAAYRDVAETGFTQLLTLFTSLRTPRDFIRGCLDLVRGDPVPLRDLADHAALNYVSAFTGRV